MGSGGSERWKVVGERSMRKVKGGRWKLKVEGGRLYGSMGIPPKTGKNSSRIWKPLEKSN